VSAPADKTANNTAGQCSASVDAGTANATDNCPGVAVAGSRSDGKALTDAYPVGSTTLSWTATDKAGNSATATQTVTVSDNEKPEISAPANVVVNSDEGLNTARVDPGKATATDNCPDVAVTGVRSDGRALTDPYPLGTTLINWTATDQAGNTATAVQK